MGQKTVAKMGFWLRWSWRDLRERWLQVGATALIIALGTSVYVGLGSTTPWREHSTRASYALLHMYDLRVTLATGSAADQERLLQAVQSIPRASAIDRIEPRLVLPVFVHVSAQGQEVWTRGQMIGVEVTGTSPHVNGISINRGRALTAADDGLNRAVVEYHFADYYDLPPQGQLQLSGGVGLDYVGTGMSPEYFMITTAEGGIWAQANFAVIFVPLATAQRLMDYPGLANDLVLTLTPQADRAAVQAELEAVLQRDFPQMGAHVQTRDDDSIYRLTYDTIGMNQEIYDIIIVLFMAGAMFGTFNLASRMVESQRRQIGIGMALGLSPRHLAIRPLLVGVQIALLGSIFGIILGLIVGKLTELWIADLFPMPVMGRLFQPRVFVAGAALGIIPPFLATFYPVWRAVRVLPVDAIRTGHLVQKSSPWMSLANRLPLPGSSLVQMPVRSLLRAPRRTLFATLGITAAISTLIGLTGILDSALLAVDKIEAETYQDHPDRLNLFLNNFYPTDSGAVSDLRHSPALSAAIPAIRVPGRVMHGRTQFNVLIELLDLDNDLWTPTLVQGRRTAASDQPGVLISENAARDLGLSVGDTFVLEHPYRTGPYEYQIVKTDVQVAGLHADPWRMFVYLDQSQAGIMGLSGLANLLHVLPAAGIDATQAKNALFQYPGVASAVSAREAVQSISAMLGEVIRFLSGVELAVLLLAFLVAFNSTNINLSERTREIATMFAFGLRPRAVTRLVMLENLITGLLGTLLGYGLGWLVLVWFCRTRMPHIMPDIRFDLTVSPTTILSAILIGVVVVALTPLLHLRKLKRMDIPSTLRVME